MLRNTLDWDFVSSIATLANVPHWFADRCLGWQHTLGQSMQAQFEHERWVKRSSDEEVANFVRSEYQKALDKASRTQ